MVEASVNQLSTLHVGIDVDKESMAAAFASPGQGFAYDSSVWVIQRARTAETRFSGLL